jgi:hypothetical protein
MASENDARNEVAGCRFQVAGCIKLNVLQPVTCNLQPEFPYLPATKTAIHV